MFVKVLRAKIHRATITQADIDYVGSISIDQDLIDQAGILPHEEVLVADIANGARFRTYVMQADRGTGTICINGAAAKLVNVGDRIIIMAFAYGSAEEARQLSPAIVLVDDKNRMTKKL